MQTAVKNAIAMIQANSNMQGKDDKGWQNKYFHQQEEKNALHVDVKEHMSNTKI